MVHPSKHERAVYLLIEEQHCLDLVFNVNQNHFQGKGELENENADCFEYIRRKVKGCICCRRMTSNSIISISRELLYAK